jgi:hypothetical protein
MLIQVPSLYNRMKLSVLLDKLKSSGPPAVTFYFTPGIDEPTLKKDLAALPGIEEVPESIRNEIIKSGTGAVLFWGMEHKYLVMPPFSVPEKVILPGYSTEGLAGILDKDYRIALVVIRMGSYGIGLFNGEKMLDSKVGTGLVHARHKKGGSSQRRYERHRDKQIEYFFTRVCGHVREKLEAHLKSIELFYFGGERNTVKLFSDWCDFLKPLAGRTSDILLNVREPRQKSLADAIITVYSSRVIEFKEE